jgi:hypothetical protein
MFRWAREFLTQPHGRLGRSRVVCLFVGSSLAENLFRLTVYKGRHDLPSYCDFLNKHLRWFRELEPRRGERAAYILVYSR